VVLKRLLKQSHLDIKPGKHLGDPVVGRLGATVWTRSCCRKELEPGADVSLSGGKVPSEEVHTYKCDAGDEGYAKGCPVSGREVASQRGHGLAIMLQSVLLPLIRDMEWPERLSVAVEDARPVDRAQGQDGVQDGGFAEASLHEKRAPEAAREGARQLGRGAAPKPL
jgi:hypothetical protein